MSLLERLQTLDRRWIFLLMAVAVAAPILWSGVTGKVPPETPTDAARTVLKVIDDLPEGSPVLFAFDYDPASAGELQPMATSLLRQCAARKLRVVCIALWPLGANLAQETIAAVIREDFPQMREGIDFANLGFQTGNEGVMKVVLTDLRKAFPVDVRGQSTLDLPILKGIHSVKDFPLLVNVSAGYPGSKEWVQYVVSASEGRVRMIAGCTGVQTPQMYPYYPGQLAGLLGAIKGAAEYEALLNETLGGQAPPKYMEAQRRMSPQLFGHLLLVALILVGNAIHLAGRRRARA
jgi:hypothetical protein